MLGLRLIPYYHRWRRGTSFLQCVCLQYIHQTPDKTQHSTWAKHLHIGATQQQTRLLRLTLNSKRKQLLVFIFAPAVTVFPSERLLLHHVGRVSRSSSPLISLRMTDVDQIFQRFRNVRSYIADNDVIIYVQYTYSVAWRHCKLWV